MFEKFWHAVSQKFTVQGAGMGGMMGPGGPPPGMVMPGGGGAFVPPGPPPGVPGGPPR